VKSLPRKKPPPHVFTVLSHIMFTLSLSLSLSPNTLIGPLSAYNLFFKDERAKMLANITENKEGGGAEGKDAAAAADGGGDSGKKRKADDQLDDDRDTTANPEEDEVKKSASTGDSPAAATADSSNPSPSPNSKKKRIGFAAMAQTIAAKWKVIDEETHNKYKVIAGEDMKRYRKQMEAYQQEQRQGLEKSREMLESTVDDSTKQQYFSAGTASGSNPGGGGDDDRVDDVGGGDDDGAGSDGGNNGGGGDGGVGDDV
jgi:hypothetical protein